MLDGKPLTLPQRAEATQKTLERFRGRSMDFAARRSCLHLVREQMVNFGYSPPPIPLFRSELGAVRALRKAGFETLEALLDGLVPRIPAAHMLVGDIALLPSEGPLGALVVYAGGAVLGWHGTQLDCFANIVGVSHFDAAWRLM